jgi:hypothetical protein
MSIRPTVLLALSRNGVQLALLAINSGVLRFE